MDIQISIVNTLVMLAAGVFGWLMRTLWTATEELKNDLTNLRQDLPIMYVLKDDYKNDIREIKEMLKILTTEIKSKEDKIVR